MPRTPSYRRNRDYFFLALGQAYPRATHLHAWSTKLLMLANNYARSSTPANVARIERHCSGNFPPVNWPRGKRPVPLCEHGCTSISILDNPSPTNRLAVPVP